MKYAQKKEYIFIREKRFYSTTHDTIRANYETILSLLSLESSKILSTTIVVHVLASNVFSLNTCRGIFGSSG